MNKSESIKELAAALSKAQSAIKTAKRDSNNPFFKSKYADLHSVWDSCREALSSNGLSIVQTVGSSIDDKNHTLTTILMHISGEYIADTAILPLTKQGPQEFGSCIKYMRRYALASFIGIVDGDDDDGEAAEKPFRQLAPPGEPIMPFGAHKGKPISQISKSDLDSAIGWAKSVNKFPDFIEKVETLKK